MRRSSVAVLIAVAIAWLSVACRSTPAAPAVSPDAWAVVDGREIPRDRVERAFRRVATPGQSLSEEEALTAKLSVLDELIVEDILLAKARALEIEVADTEVDAAYANMEKGVANGGFQQELTRRNLTPADIRDGLRREAVVQKLLEREVGSKITVTDQDITTFFNANRAQFNLPEEAYHLAQIVVTPVREPQPTNRTGDDAATPEAAATKVGMLMERLKGGAAFADLARDYSEDPESAPRGGDLGLVPLSAVNQAAPALRDAVLKMTPGAARVVSGGGAHTIVFLVEKEPAGQRDPSMPEVRQRITETLRGRQEQLLRTAYLTAARSDATVVNYLARQVVEKHGASTPVAPLGK